MFESLKRAIDEIFGSVIRPVKDWVLRRSWGVRVLCLIVIGLAAFSYWKPETVVGLSQQASLYWRSWRSHSDKIPLSGSAQQSLALALKRLSPSVEADLSANFPDSPLTPWSASQSVLALRAAGRPLPDKDAYVAFVNAGRFAPDCFCWTELEEQPRSEVAGYISGWVMAAFAGIGVPLGVADYDYMLGRQNAAGWWPMFPESGASQYASTYTTAWIALGLHQQRSAGLVPADRRPAVDRAIFRAAAWLMHARHGARWKAHPNAPMSDTPETLSGFVLHVLHQVGSLDLTDVDRAWLDALPHQHLKPSDLDKHYTVLQSGHRSKIDHIVEIRLPWILLGTADAYASGTAAQKARTLSWIEAVLRDPEVRGADTEGVEWVRAEVLIGIAEASKRAECGPCGTGGQRTPQGE
jgi:hypothetical protein